jgi:hypothetical protein
MIISYLTPGIPLINFLLAFFTTLGLTALWLNKNQALQNWLELHWRKYFGLIFYLTALIFALYHISNYNPSPRQLAYAPLIVLPQFAAGLFFGFTRIRYGLPWSMLMHGLYNTVLISTSLITGDL